MRASTSVSRTLHTIFRKRADAQIKEVSEQIEKKRMEVRIHS